MTRVEKQRPQQRSTELHAPSPAAPASEQTAIASAVGNQAFGALIGAAGASTASARALVSPNDHAMAGRLARAVLARENGHGEGATAVAEPPGAAASWTAPLALGAASDHERAAFLCAQLVLEAVEMLDRGFEEEFRLLHDEATSRREQFRQTPEAALTATEIQQLTEFGAEFQQAHTAAIRRIASQVAAQFESWRVAPISAEDLFELRETVHEHFVAGDEGRLAQLTELLESLEELTGAVDTWVGYGAQAASLVSRAERLSQIHDAVESIHSRVEEVQQIITLARDIGRLAGVLGDGPAGVDDISRIEGGLGALDFVVGHAEVPGITQLWSGYILPAAQACLHGLRNVLDTLYLGERGNEIQFFFDQHLRDRHAPGIAGSLARFGNLDRHFPGGQPVFDFMWRLMRGDATTVPDAVEDYFVRYRDEFNAGMGAGNEVETDSAWSNAWNLVTREESPNLLRWVRENRQEVWTRLYGGMPAPTG